MSTRPILVVDDEAINLATLKQILAPHHPLVFARSGNECLAAAVKLYELGRLSSGAAAALADIPRTAFLSKLADYGVDTFRQTEDELREEVANA